MNLIFQIDGGMGKSVAATAVCKAINTQYPNDTLIVITGYPEVFMCNPRMKVYGFNELRYFYEQYIEGKEYKIMAHNPYLETAFVKGDTHVIQVWSEMFGIKYNGEMPEVIINDREQHFFGNQLATPKPLLLLQTNGGGKDQPNKYSWTRDLPLGTAQKIVNAFANDYTIVHLRRPDQLPLQNVITVPENLGFRGMAALINMAAKCVFIDSFAQHTAAALGKPAVVCMLDEQVVNQFGYALHTNIIANPPTIKPELRHSVYNKYNISGVPIEFPYHHEGEIYNVAQIIEAVIALPSNSLSPGEGRGEVTPSPLERDGERSIPEPIAIEVAKAEQNGNLKRNKKNKKELAQS